MLASERPISILAALVVALWWLVQWLALVGELKQHRLKCGVFLWAEGVKIFIAIGLDP